MKTKKIILCLIMVCLSLISVFFSGCLGFSSLTSPILKSELIDASNVSSQQELINSVAPAVVGIVSNTSGYDSIGTGVCVSEKGYILTNNHVIENSTSIRLYLYNGTTCSASIKWADVSQDLAVLQASKEIPYLPMAAKNGYQTGEEVIAIGTPISIQFKHSATKGIISATNRTLQVDTSLGASTLSSLIQHDASINPGNSGGPLINLKGQVIGINTAKITDAEGLGFAIPIDIAKPVVQNLNADGSYKTAYLGVVGYDAGFSNGFNRANNGVYIIDVDKNSPAQKLGLKQGDIVVSINGQKINNWLEMKENIYSLKERELVSITYTRNGKNYTQDIILKAHPCCKY